MAGKVTGNLKSRYKLPTVTDLLPSIRTTGGHHVEKISSTAMQFSILAPKTLYFIIYSSPTKGWPSLGINELINIHFKWAEKNNKPD